MTSTTTPATGWRFESTDGSPITFQIPTGRRVSIGRAVGDARPDIVIPASCRSASRAHAALEIGDRQAVLSDQSRFGTLVNGRPYHNESVDLRDGDEVVFGLAVDGWRVRFRAPASLLEYTTPADPLELLVVTENPRQVRLGRQVIEEQLGKRAFRLLKFLSEHKGEWYPTAHLEDLMWPDPDESVYATQSALSRDKKKINDLLRPYLDGQDAVESHQHRGYRMKTRVGHL